MSEPFRAVEWMRQMRARIDEEDRNLSWWEKSRRTEEILAADPFWQRFRSRLEAPVSARRQTPLQEGR